MSGLIVGSDCSSGIDEIRNESSENNWYDDALKYERKKEKK